MSLNSRVTALEKTLEKHLIESGEIRSDLRWLKRAFWTIASGIITFCVIASGYILNHTLK